MFMFMYFHFCFYAFVFHCSSPNTNQQNQDDSNIAAINAILPIISNFNEQLDDLQANLKYEIIREKRINNLYKHKCNESCKIIAKLLSEQELFSLVNNSLKRNSLYPSNINNSFNLENLPVRCANQGKYAGNPYSLLSRGNFNLFGYNPYDYKRF